MNVNNLIDTFSGYFLDTTTGHVYIYNSDTDFLSDLTSGEIYHILRDAGFIMNLKYGKVELLNDTKNLLIPSSAPQSLAVSYSSGGNVLTWVDSADNSKIDGFEIWVSDNGAASILLAMTEWNVKTYTDTTNYINGHTISYTVRGYKGVVYTSYSDPYNAPTITWETEYTTLYNSFTNKPTGSTPDYQNTLMIAVNKVRSKLGGFYVFAQSSNAAGEALKNWISPGTIDATLQGSPTFTSMEGFTGVAGGNYIKTCNNNVMPYFTQNDASYGVYLRTNVDESQYDIGYYDTGWFIWGSLKARTGNTMAARINDNTEHSITNSDSRGLFVDIRTSSTARKLFKNKTGTSSTQASAALHGAALSVLSASGQTNSTKQASIAFFGGSLTDQEENDLYDAIQAYMTSIGKNV